MKKLFQAALVALMLVPSWGLAQDFDKGLAAYQAGDYAVALQELRPLAKQGDAAAQYNLGRMYANGYGISQDDAEAVDWYRKAAEQGYADAQYNLGGMYSNGKGVLQDDAEAVTWWRKAAEQGDAYAQTNLGFMYRDGEGVLQDAVLAHMWFNIAGANGIGGSDLRGEVEQRMTREQIAEAQARARRCMASDYQDCD